MLVLREVHGAASDSTTQPVSERGIVMDTPSKGLFLSRETIENVHHCNKCGLCMAACPVYRELLVESFSPRGKVQLSRQVIEGQLDMTPKLREILSNCLLCGSCVATCPSGVQGDRLFSGLRWRVTQRLGVHWKKRVLFQILAHRWATSSSVRLARWAMRFLGNWLGVSFKAGALPLERIPPLSQRPFSEEAPEVTPAKGNTRARVLYFHGCATNYIFPHVGRAVLDVLSAMGVEVITPRGQGCCGVPIFLSGAREASLGCVEEAVREFSKEEVDAVIVDCATCGSALVREYPHLLGELRELGEEVSHELIDKARILSGKAKDIMAFIGDHMAWLPEVPFTETRLRVTYHDPCHLLKAQGVGMLPRKVLAGLPNVEFVEMDSPDACCGGGGSFQVEHPEISKNITQRKIRSIEATRAQVVATGCPGCRITIGAHLDPSSHVMVLHPVELVQMALSLREMGSLTQKGGIS